MSRCHMTRLVVSFAVTTTDLFVTWESAVDQGRGPIGHHLAGLAPPPGSFFPGWTSPLSILFLLLFFSLRLQHIYMNVSQVVSLSFSLSLLLSFSLYLLLLAWWAEGGRSERKWHHENFEDIEVGGGLFFVGWKKCLSGPSLLCSPLRWDEGERAWWNIDEKLSVRDLLRGIKGICCCCWSLLLLLLLLLFVELLHPHFSWSATSRNLHLFSAWLLPMEVGGSWSFFCWFYFLFKIFFIGDPTSENWTGKKRLDVSPRCQTSPMWFCFIIFFFFRLRSIAPIMLGGELLMSLR